MARAVISAPRECAAGHASEIKTLIEQHAAEMADLRRRHLQDMYVRTDLFGHPKLRDVPLRTNANPIFRLLRATAELMLNKSRQLESQSKKEYGNRVAQLATIVAERGAELARRDQSAAYWRSRGWEDRCEPFLAPLV